MREHVRTRGHERDRDWQLSLDGDLGQGTRQEECRGTGHEDRVQDRVYHRTGGLSARLSWGAVAGQGAVLVPIVGGCCNTRIANEISKRASCAVWELSG